AAVQPAGIVDAYPAMILQMIRSELRRRNRNQIARLPGFVVLMSGIEVMRQDAAVQCDQPVLETGPRRFHPFVPGKLEVAHIGRGGVERSARIERTATVEPPPGYSRPITRAQLANDAHQIAGQSRFVLSVIPYRVFPLRI